MLPPGSREAFKWAKRILSLAADTQKNAADIQELRQEIKQLNQRIDRLTDALKALYSQQQRDRENAAHEREKQEMRLKIALLEAGKQLPPPEEKE